MNPSVQPVSPFAMLVDPEAALAAIQRSERLARLQGRICRPLDRVAGAHPGDAEATATSGGSTWAELDDGFDA